MTQLRDFTFLVNVRNEMKGNEVFTCLEYCVGELGDELGREKGSLTGMKKDRLAGKKKKMS